MVSAMEKQRHEMQALLEQERSEKEAIVREHQEAKLEQQRSEMQQQRQEMQEQRQDMERLREVAAEARVRGEERQLAAQERKLPALQARLQTLQAAKLLTDEELCKLEDIIVDNLEAEDSGGEQVAKLVAGAVGAAGRRRGARAAAPAQVHLSDVTCCRQWNVSSSLPALFCAQHGRAAQAAVPACLSPATAVGGRLLSREG